MQTHVNIAYDKEATRGQTFFKSKHRENAILPEEVGALLMIEGKQILRKMKEAIYFAAHALDMKTHLENMNEETVLRQ